MREQHRRIEHRWSQRSALILDAILYCSGQMPFAARTRNLGIGGMFVETKSARLSPNSQVFVAFSVQSDGDTTHHRMAARVIRLTDDGAGLMFSDFGVDAVHALKHILRRGEYMRPQQPVDTPTVGVMRAPI